MSVNLREILKKIGITQQELADYLGITRQYLNNYLDETIEEPKMPQKYINNLLFLFECKSREDLFNEEINQNAKAIKKRMNKIKITKDSIDNLFNIENEKKLQLFKIVEYFQALTKLDIALLESFAIFMENVAKDTPYKSILSYIAKRYMIIDFEDEKYNDQTNLSREALLYKALEYEQLNYKEYKDLYEEFTKHTREQNNFDLDALRLSLNELGYTNITQKEVVDILKKYNEIKVSEEKE